MSIPKTLAAYTPPGFSPPYVNFSLTDDGVQITVRSPAEDDGSCGEVSAMTLSAAEFKKLISEAAQQLPE